MDGHEQPTLGLYISIPFCRSKCTFCNFSSGVYPAGEHFRYIDRVIEDLRGAKALIERVGAELPERVDTVYLGGGTPNLLEPELLRRLFAAVRTEFSVDADAEITMECAPGQLPETTLEAMTGCGVNRASLGVQSFIDREAHECGRLHDRATIEADLCHLRAAGITNISIDLIAGLAGQTFASWEESLAALTNSMVTHASVYMLEIDEDSRLGRELLTGGMRYRASLVPDEDAVARMYERAVERLGQAGIKRYEISNFAQAGFESRHNLRYWQRKPYLGVGLDASSMLRSAPDVFRWTTTDELRDYLAGPQEPEIERLSPNRQHEEAWFLGLRLDAGVEIAALEREFGRPLVSSVDEIASRLTQDGLLEIENGRVRLTPRGRMLSNEVFQEFIADRSEHSREESHPQPLAG